MKNKKKEDKIQKSFDLISKEMAEFVVNNKKVQIESEIEKDILDVEKKKRRREKELRKTKKIIIQRGNESSESEQLNYNKNNNYNLRRSNSREDMRNFKPKNNSNTNNDRILNKNEKIYNKDNKENFSANISFKNNSKEKLDKNKKEEIEITISPLFDNKDDEDDEINYYNIRDYLDNKKHLEKKKLNSQRLGHIRKSNSIYNKKNPIKRGFTLNKMNKLKRISRERKREYSFLFEDQQKDDSDDWSNYLEDLTLKKESDNLGLYTNSKNNTFNKTLKDSSDNEDSDEITTNQKNMLKNSNMIFDYYQDKKYDKKDFLEKQLNRKRLTEIKINRKRERIKYLESKNNYYNPKIDELSLEIIKNKGNYIPLFKRAVELENEKKMKILIKQKINNKSLSLNTSKIKKRTKKQINEFFKTQINWKNKIEKQNNILRLKLRAKEKENEKNTESNFSPRLSKSELNISRRKSKQKSSFALYDNNICKSTTYSIYLKENIKSNIGYKLYKDYETRQKNLNRLKKKLTPSFTPIINKSTSFASRNYSWTIKRRNLSKSIENKSTSLIFEYDSSFNSKLQKSRNPKGVDKKKFINNKNKFSQPFNVKEINNYLKSTAVDSRNSKSRSSLEIFGSKLEKINEYKDQDEEYSSSDFSLNNISNNKNTNSKIYKSNKNNKSINFEQNKKIYSGKTSNNNITYASEEKNQSKIENLTNKSISKELNLNKEETKSLIEHKDSSKKLLKEYSTGKIKENLKLDDIKEFLDLDQQNTNKASQTPTLGKNISKKNSKEKLNLKSNLKKKSVEIKDVKKINEVKNDDNIDINRNNESNDKEKEKNDNDEIEVNKDKKIVKIFDNKNINNKSNGKIKDKIDIKNNPNSKRTKKINPFSKLFSKEKIEHNPKINNRNYFDRKKSKTIFQPNKSSSSLSNNYNELDNQPQDDNTFKNQYDSIETNNNQFNFEHKDSNYINDFLTNKASSNLSYKEENLIQNSSYNLDKEMLDSQNSLNLNIPDETKKTEKEIIKQYKIDDSEDSEEEEENEETEKNSDKIDNNEKKEKSFSWISKLNDISRNEGFKSEINYYNKKKTGGSTTRPQTKRQNENNNFNTNKNLLENLEENKLYMLNLRNSSSTGNLNPYTIVAKDPMFYKFFLKKPKNNN